ACSLMHEPDILFLDEPTSGVDPLTRREFWLHINSMVEKGVTVFLQDIRPYLPVMVAAFLINVLSLAGIVFSMQVYDRVIPAQSYP
ncbi:hypothetical protein MJN76_29495, partial [Salmonella enterica subsp. enterica serovar Anatum]|nr:hypothetical protein [Salmonella enterica subsp. enterica serovar Anatum]